MQNVSSRKKGRYGERRVSGLLKKWCRSNRAYALNGIYLPLYKGCCEIDHLVAGAFGVAVIETKAIGGALEGKPSDRYLVNRMGNRTHRLYNPLLQNKTHVDNVIYHLKKAGMGNVPVYGFAVFAGECVPKKALGISAEELSDALSALPRAVSSQKEIRKLFKSLSVKNPIKKLFHYFSVRKKSA